MKATSYLGIPLIVLPSLFGLAACGGGSDAGPAPSVAAAPAPPPPPQTPPRGASGVATGHAFGIASTNVGLTVLLGYGRRACGGTARHRLRGVHPGSPANTSWWSTRLLRRRRLQWKLRDGGNGSRKSRKG